MNGITSSPIRKRARARIRSAAAWILLVWPAAASSAPPTASDLTFEKDILPIFQARCLTCHGGEAPRAELDLRTKGQLIRGGKSGPVLRVGAAQASLIWEKIVSDQMPAEGEKLTPDQKAMIRGWIDAGAKGDDAALPDGESPHDVVTDADREFWSLRPALRPDVPGVRQADRVRNAIDNFVLSALEAKGLSYAPEADRLALLRRACFDLLGLPPSDAQSIEFQSDTAPGAWERLIDRLLASPHYGERWGRHWLDAAGYADSEGILSADYERTASWRYRDYVIQAFNKDTRYDRFLQEQIAGDELNDYWAAFVTQPQLPPEVTEGLVATGFLRCASDTSRPDFAQIKNAPGYYYQTLDDTLKIVASSTMGLTLQCARCHSHKYDPIPQRDYYRLQAVFMGAYRPYQWVPQVERKLMEASQAQITAANEHNARIDAAVVAIVQEGEVLKAQYAGRLLDDRLARLPEPIREDTRTALAADPSTRTDVQKYLAEKFQAELKPEGDALIKALTDTYPEAKAMIEQRLRAIAAENAKKIALPEIRALYDLPGEAHTPVLLRGDYRTPGAVVSPGVLSAIVTERPFDWTPPPEGAKTSGRRLAFARWLTQPDHPLTARVMVNRVWMHHFGEGIVSTPDDFGATGAAPSHPELLDWLAVEFVARGWSVKGLHRLLMNSSAYRQQSWRDRNETDAARSIDPDNRLLWRQRLRRLEGEALRDAVLATAGTLNRQMFGPPVPMQMLGDGEVVTPAGPAGDRRSVYLQVRRSQPLTLLQLFDQPVMETNCARRGQSTVSLQALTLLNSDFMVGQAAAFAARAAREEPADAVGRAVRLAFGRPATESERARLSAFVGEQSARHIATLTTAGAAPTPEQQAEAERRALADVCHMLLCANEFAYVD
jgi:hypothetical protein